MRIGRRVIVGCVEKVMALRSAGQRGGEAGRLLPDQARPAYMAWLASINQLIDIEEGRNKIESAKARSVAQGSMRLQGGKEAFRRIANLYRKLPTGIG